MAGTVIHYRIFISSPGDVDNERELARALIKEKLPYLTAFRDLVTFDVVTWDDPAVRVPMLANKTPQESVNRMIKRPANCDIVVVILWSHLGTPLPDTILKEDGKPYRSGTEWEYLDALNSPSRPDILIYRRTEKPKIEIDDPDFMEKREQFSKVNEFFEQFRNEDGSLAGGINEYESPDVFKDLLRQHLERIVWEALKEADDTEPGKAEKSVGHPPPAAEETSFSRRPKSKEEREAAKERYLDQLRTRCCLLPLAAMGADPGKEDTVTLEDVYISLNTTVEREIKKREKKAEEDELLLDPLASVKPLSAMDAIGEASHVVLLGKPGSGKSTFINQIIVSYIEALQNQKSERPANLPVGLIPIKIVLRDLAQRLAGAGLPEGLPGMKQHDLAGLLLDQAVHDLADLDARDFEDDLVEAFRSKKCLLVLDGLDEVQLHLREAVREVVRAVVSMYKPQRLIITCRIRSYQEESGRIPLLATYTLAPFNDDQKRLFARGWYRTPANRQRFSESEAKTRSDLLATAATDGSLSELAANPMLLTTMAIIHQRDIGLPEERVKLYLLAVDVLVRRWQRAKTQFDEEKNNEALEAFLQDDRRLRRTLTRLAYEAHRSKEAVQEAADLSRKEAVFILEADEYLGSLGLAEAFLDYVDHRSGLLVGHGGGVGAGSKPVSYSFPHRTFQEYLAGCYLVSLPDLSGALIDHAKEGSYWYEAVKLGLEELLHNREREWELISLAYPLSPITYPEQLDRQRLILWAGFIASLVGADLIASDTRFPEQGPAFLRRIKEQFTGVLGGTLPPIEQAEAGRILSRLGDPREELLTLEAMPFSYVSAGPFLMGDKTVEVDVPYGYWISQYPVTNAQFEWFEKSGGYEESQWWTEAGWAWLKKQGQQGKMRYKDPFDLPNHPVVVVSWYEAYAFTQWLTAEVRKQGWIEETTEIKLPNEPEWEKAARGGLQVPEEIKLSRLQNLTGTTSVSLEKNSYPDRRYPWGEKITAEHCNYGESGIGSTTTPGCFPQGMSPYGVHELSGNVWEWNRSLYEKAAYTKSGAEQWENYEAPEGNDLRVLRGGSFVNLNNRRALRGPLQGLSPY